jgi:hypothetical protein
MSASDSLSFWPFYKYYLEFIEKPALDSLSGDKVACGAVVLDLTRMKTAIENLSKLVCDHCSGFGHVATDYRNGAANEKRFCPTGELMDILVKYCLTNKITYLMARR